MKVLVTGGAGYIGSHVVSLLLEKGYEVVVFDNLSSGHVEALSNNVEFVEGDLLNKDDLESCFNNHQFDGILHFASLIRVEESMKDPFKYFNNNYVGTINLVEQAVEHKVLKFVFSSTANLYDQPQHVPISETEEVIPGSVYGETKMLGERLLNWADQVYGLKYCALRYFNASGADPRGHIGEDHNPETHLIPRVLFVPLGKLDKVYIYGNDYDTPDGTAIRDYIHVMDLAKAHILALEVLSESKSRVYNLGSGSGYSVREIVNLAEKVTNFNIPTTETPRRPGDLPILIADNSLIQRELGWKPEYDLQGIIETAWQWHRTHPEGFNAIKGDH